MKLAPIFEQIATLRDPETGCPWDREQILSRYAEPIREEAEELVEAIQSGDMNHLREEAGDLLWNLCFLLHLAGEEGAFTPEEVVEGVVEKMRRLHPHVYEGVEVATAEEALKVFQEAKNREKAASLRRGPAAEPENESDS